MNQKAPIPAFDR